MKSILIKDTTKEERIQIVQQGLGGCGLACDFCSGCGNLGGGSVDAFYEPYINGEKELWQLNEEYALRTRGLCTDVSVEISSFSFAARKRPTPL